MCGVRAPQRPCGNLRESDRAHFAGAHEFAHRAYRLFYGNALVPAMQVVQIDAVTVQIAQRFLAEGADGLGPPVDHALAVTTEQPALARNDDVGGSVPEHIADELFVDAEAIESSGVEMRDPEIERAAQDAFGDLARLRWPVAVRKIHAAETDGGDFERAKLSGGKSHAVFHSSSGSGSSLSSSSVKLRATRY